MLHAAEPSVSACAGEQMRAGKGRCSAGHGGCPVDEPGGLLDENINEMERSQVGSSLRHALRCYILRYKHSPAMVSSEPMALRFSLPGTENCQMLQFVVAMNDSVATPRAHPARSLSRLLY